MSLDRLIATLATWHQTARTRAALARVSPERLPDIGLTSAQARAEAARPFWMGTASPRATSCPKPAPQRTLRAFGN